MGDMADMYIDMMFDRENICEGCGRDMDYCNCDAQGRPLKKKHPKDCPGKPVLRRNGKTQEEFIGCSAFPSCKWSRNL